MSQLIAMAKLPVHSPTPCPEGPEIRDGRLRKEGGKEGREGERVGCSL